MLFSSAPPSPWKPAVASRLPARGRNPPSFSYRSLDSRVHAPVLGSDRSDHLGFLSHSSASPLVSAPKLLRGPELGLLSVLFVLSAACKRLKISSEELSKVVAEEVPGTVSCLRLSGMEINGLTSKLNNLRQILSGRQHGKKERTDNSITN